MAPHPRLHGGSTMCATVVTMGRSLHVRLDDSSEAALAMIRNTGLSDSEAVRVALREAAAHRRTRASITAEAKVLAANEEDLAEMRAVREHLAELAPEYPEE
jgi:hypothetical protein